MSLRTTGFTKKTAENLLLDAGAIYKNLKKKDGKWEGEALGATSGGNEFTVELEQRQPEIDGLKVRMKGMSFVESHEAQLEVNLKELTAENLKVAIGPADIDESDADSYVITGRTHIENEDYLENIAYVGRLSKGGEPVIIILKNALSAEGFVMASEDNDEAVVPITFHAHVDFDDAEKGKTAYEIHWPKDKNADNGSDGEGENADDEEDGEEEGE